jgi:hypothetical protein
VSLCKKSEWNADIDLDKYQVLNAPQAFCNSLASQEQFPGAKALITVLLYTIIVRGRFLRVCGKRFEALRLGTTLQHCAVDA